MYLDPCGKAHPGGGTAIGTSDHNVRALVLQPDGKVIVVGSSRNVGQDSDFAIVRYLSDGALDPAFGTGGVVLTDFSGQIDVGRAVALQGDGRIVVAGSTISDDGTAGDMAFARYESDGALDATFGTAGRVTIDMRGTADQARGVSLIPGGKIVAAGTTRDPAASRIDIAAVRLDVAGALDATFGTGGKFISAFGGPGSQVANALAVGSSGTTFLAGPYPPDLGVFALTNAGSLSPAFGTAGLALLREVDLATRVRAATAG